MKPTDAAVPLGVAPRLVEALGAARSAGRTRPPPARPSTSQIHSRSQPRSRATAANSRWKASQIGLEGRRLVLPARGVKPGERAEVLVQALGVAEPEGEVVALGQLALPAPHLVAEVLALGGQELSQLWPPMARVGEGSERSTRGAGSRTSPPRR